MGGRGFHLLHTDILTRRSDLELARTAWHVWRSKKDADGCYTVPLPPLYGKATQRVADFHGD
jgi:hypothetical protein